MGFSEIQSVVLAFSPSDGADEEAKQEAADLLVAALEYARDGRVVSALHVVESQIKALCVSGRYKLARRFAERAAEEASAARLLPFTVESVGAVEYVKSARTIDLRPLRRHKLDLHNPDLRRIYRVFSDPTPRGVR
jgi:hypothetical protein